jgi:hypothetical protein
MNYLQSLVYSKPTRTNERPQHKTSSQVNKNEAKASASVTPRSSEIGLKNVDMLQAWVSGGSVTVAKPTAREKNAGQRLDFFG